MSSKSSSLDAAGDPPAPVTTFKATDREITPVVAGAKAFAEATRAKSERISFILMYMMCGDRSGIGKVRRWPLLVDMEEAATLRSSVVV